LPPLSDIFTALYYALAYAMEGKDEGIH